MPEPLHFRQGVGGSQQAVQRRAHQPHQGGVALFVDVVVGVVAQPGGVAGVGRLQGGPLCRRQPVGGRLAQRRLEAPGGRGLVAVINVNFNERAVAQLAQAAARLAALCVVALIQPPQQRRAHGKEGEGDQGQGAQPRLAFWAEGIVAAAKGGGKGGVVIVQGVAAGGAQLGGPVGQEAFRRGVPLVIFAAQQGDGQGVAGRGLGYGAGQLLYGRFAAAFVGAGAAGVKQFRPGAHIHPLQQPVAAGEDALIF